MPSPCAPRTFRRIRTRLWPLTFALLLAGCAPPEPLDCPEPGARPFSLACDGMALQCRGEQMQLGSLGPLSVSSEATAVVPWREGVLRIAADLLGQVEAQAFDEALFARGAGVALLPSVPGTHPVAVRALPLPEGAVVVVLEQDAGTTRHRLTMVRLTHGGRDPEVSTVEPLWEGLHLGAGPPELHLDVEPSGATLVLALGTSSEGEVRRLHLVRADPGGQRTPLMRDFPLMPATQTLPAGIALLGDGSVLLAGMDWSGEGGSLWVDHLDADLEVLETLWTAEQEMLPTSTALIASPGAESGALGWFMPSPGEGLSAGIHRVEGMGAGPLPTRIDIWLGSYFGPHDGGRVEQALAYEGDQLVQLSLELGAAEAGSPARPGVLRMDAGITSFNPWEMQPLLRVPVDDHRLQAQRLPQGGILATVPLLEDDGGATLGLFRICLPL